MKTTVEELLDVAAFCGKRRETLIDATVNEGSPLTVDRDQGCRNMGLLENIGLLLPDHRLQIPEMGDGSDKLAVSLSLFRMYRSLP